MKADYNEFVPLQKKFNILVNIENRLNLFLNDFQKQYSNELNDNFIDLLTEIKKVIEVWKKEVPQTNGYTVQISELPLATMNLYP